MPLYKLFCIAAHYPEYRHIKDLVSSSAKFLLDQGSAVREVRYLGLKNLPQRMKRHKQKHAVGDYWHMNFDASPFILKQLNDRMRTDHRVIRWTMLKLGEKLPDVADELIRETNTVNYSLHPQTIYFTSGPTSRNLTGSALSQVSGGGWSFKGPVAGLGGEIGEAVDIAQFEGDRLALLGAKPYARGPIPE